MADRTIGGRGRRVTLLAQRYVMALGGVAYAFTLGIRKSRHRALIADMARHFGYAGHVRGLLPVSAYDDLASPAIPVSLPAVLGGSGNVSTEELVALARVVAVRRPATLLEIGTFDGRTTRTLAANAPANAEVITLDLPPETPASLPLEARDVVFIDKKASGARFAGTPEAARIRQVYGDSANYDFGKLQVDFAFIDGSHSYEYVMSDSRRVRALLRGGRGIIFWHDYGGEWEGVTRALDELAQTPEFAGLRQLEGTTLAFLDLER